MKSYLEAEMFLELKKCFCNLRLFSLLIFFISLVYNALLHKDLYKFCYGSCTVLGTFTNIR